MRQFLLNRWFLLLLGVVLALGLTWPHALESPLERLPDELVLASVLFLMALPLELSAMWRAFRRPGATLLAIAMNYGLLPVLACLIALGMQPGLGQGLVVTAAVPCTLASAAVWTRRAGGNDAVALLVMISTNLACFLATPFWLVVGTGQRREVDVGPIILTLVLYVALPILVGQLLRVHRGLASWATHHRTSLSVVAQLGILTMVLVGAVQAGLTLRTASETGEIGWFDWALLFVAVVGLHLLILSAGIALARLFRLAPPEQIAVGIAGSQKTLMIGVHLGVSFGGLAVLPMVAYHVCQLLIDTLVVDWWRERYTGRTPPELTPSVEAVADSS